MFRKVILGAALLAATLSPAAYAGDYIEGRVISVVPHLSLSFGSLINDGFRVEYEFGGNRYNTHSHPGRMIVVPPPFRVAHSAPRFDHRFGHRNDHWRDQDRHGWRDHDRRDDRRHGRGNDRRRGHQHDRH